MYKNVAGSNIFMTGDNFDRYPFRNERENFPWYGGSVLFSFFYVSKYNLKFYIMTEKVWVECNSN